MLVYKVDALQELKKRGFSSYVLQKEKIFGAADVHKLRAGLVLGINGIAKLCELLRMQPGQVLRWIPDGCAEAIAEQQRRDGLKGGSV